MQRGDKASRTGATRREIMAAAGASAVALSIGAGLSSRPAVATGTVFEDRGGTGRRRPGDPGIPGILVSNGRDVARTDADGRWRLPVADGDSLFVVKPANWSTPIGPGGLPQFSYLHHPGGSPDGLYHRGVAPTGELPASIDFPLRRQDEGRAFEALLLADTQPGDDEELGYLRDDVIAAIPGSGAAFAINHGDVVFDDLSLYARYLQLIGATGIPWHHCPGNHDINLDAGDDGSSRDTWKRTFGPRHYAFQHAGATFIVLDNVYYFGHNPGSPHTGRYVGRVGEAQLQFARNILAQVPREALIVLSMHIPLLTYQDAGNPADNTADRDALLALLAGRPHTASFSGHMHLTEHHYLGPEAHHHHVLAAASGGWWGGPVDRRGIPLADCPDGTPNGFHVLEVDGSRYATRFVPSAGKPRARLRALVHNPDRSRLRNEACDWGASVCAADLGACQLVVNVFDGGPRTRVACEAAGRSPPPPMQRREMPDPLVAELFARQPQLQKPWVKPVAASHIWTAPLPPDLPPGVHRLTIRATDEYGRDLAATLMLEVTADAKA
jgi:hypothetical protein